MSMHNAAVFVNGKRVTRGVNVEWDDGQVKLVNRSNFATFQTYDVEEMAALETDSNGETKTAAWDMVDTRGQKVRLVVQKGCGCSGLIQGYQTLPTYSGALTRK